MKRNIYAQLEGWKISPRRKPLVLNGARQVGKTYSLKYFGKHFYKNTAYFNFEKDEKLCRYFDETLDPKQLIKYLSLHGNVDIFPQDTLLVFDEIQECPKALNSLKYFCEEASDYHVVAAGSLLGVKMVGDKGFPVGKINFLHLYPLTFFEFLTAIGQEKIRTLLEEVDSYEPFPEVMHERLIQYLKVYFFVGGMPEVVAEYVERENIHTVREVQKEILSSYEKDFAKHAPLTEIMKITTVWKQIHAQLAKENKKFIFSHIRTSARGREYEEAIQWLLDAGLIHKSCLTETPKFPLSAYAESNHFKIFLLDIGLLGAQSDLSPQVILEGNQLFTEFKGSLIENYVAQELIAADQKALYYWTSEGTAEIDFLLEHNNEIFPLEVKSGASQKKKSLLVYDKKYIPSKLLRATLMNLKHDGKVCNYPLYLVSKISKF